jgi:hypothetical protein
MVFMIAFTCSTSAPNVFWRENPQILDTPLESTERLLKGKMTMPQEKN